MTVTDKKILRMCIDAMFVALIVIFTFVPNLGFITIGPISFTTIHLIVLVGAFLFGIFEGSILGLAFGLCSLFKAMTMPAGVADYLFINPLISVLPRLIFGFLAGVLFQTIRNKVHNKVGFCVLSGVLSGLLTLFHTAMVIPLLYAFMPNEDITFFTVLSAIFTLNCVVEISLAVVLVPLISIPLLKSATRLRLKMQKGKKKHMKKVPVFIEEKVEETLNTLANLIKIPSVYDATSVSKLNPYGKYVSEALAFLKEEALRLGFESATIYDNRVLEIDVGGSGPIIGVFAHCDVVSAEGNWSYPPFTLTRVNDLIYGRGVIDDKGPLVLIMYVLKILKEQNKIKNHKLRLVIGGDEERGSSCLNYYFETLKKEEPEYAFTPDADFPLIYSEKGILHFYLSSTITLKNVISIEAGNAFNICIDKAKIELKEADEEFIKFLDAKKIEYDTLDDKTIIFKGKASHGSLPLLGKNAFLIAIAQIGEFYDEESLKELYSMLIDQEGKGLNIYVNDETLGSSSLNIGLANYKNNCLSVGIDYRHPHLLDYAQIVENINKFHKYSYKEISYAKPLYVDPEGKLVKTLLTSYRKISGDTISKPLAIGGGTYAKEVKNCVAFGPAINEKDYHMHGVDEFYDINEMKQAMHIYYEALLKLLDL